VTFRGGVFPDMLCLDLGLKIEQNPERKWISEQSAD